MLVFDGSRFVETSADGKGAYVAMLVSRDSADRIVRWAEAMGIQDIVSPQDMHATVVYSPERGLDQSLHGDRSILPLLVPPGDRHTTVFDKDGEPGALVLEFACRPLEKRHEWYTQNYGLEHSFPEFRPHVTLSYSSLSTPDHVLDRVKQRPMPLPFIFDRERVAWCNP